MTLSNAVNGLVRVRMIHVQEDFPLLGHEESLHSRLHDMLDAVQTEDFEEFFFLHVEESLLE